MILDAALVARRRRELGLSVRELAAALGVTGAVVTGIEAGSNHGQLMVGTVTKLADALAIPLPDLMAGGDEQTDPVDGVDETVAQLGILLAQDRTLIPVTALAEALDVDIAAVHQAAQHLANRLAGTGLCIHKRGSAYAIRPAASPDTDQLARLIRRQHARASISASEARMLAAIIGGKPPQSLGNAERVAVGRLSNAGLIDAATMRVADEVRESLLLDE